MKVAVYYTNNDIRIEERPVPAISGNELLVKMMASGICGTDIMEWYRIQKAPRILGHEMSGEIVRTGSKTSPFKTGQRVFVSHHVPCYECHYCLKGHYTACEQLHAGNYDPGGFSEFIRIPEENVIQGTFLLPDSVTFEDATMVEPLACAIAGQEQLRLKKGLTVLIIGSGVAGLLHGKLAKMKGLRVIAVDINEYRLSAARSHGADYSLNGAAYSVDLLKRINGNRLADYVIVCTTAQTAIETALSSVDRRGEILFFAVPQNNIVIPSTRFWRDEITVTFSYGASPDDIREALRLMESRAIEVSSLITDRIPLSDIQEGFRRAAEGKKSLKVIVVPDQEN
ncbi:MAG: alcohol dehydrogenase catalytic domain-containing protein [Nitrospirota bacterium]